MSRNYVMETDKDVAIDQDKNIDRLTITDVDG